MRLTKQMRAALGDDIVYAKLSAVAIAGMHGVSADVVQSLADELGVPLPKAKAKAKAKAPTDLRRRPRGIARGSRKPPGAPSMRERRAIASAQMAVADCDTAIANTKRITALYDDLLRASKLLLEALDLPPRARNRERAIRTCARNVRKRVPGAVTEARCKGPAAALYEAGGADVASRAEEAEASAADGSADVQ